MIGGPDTGFDNLCLFSDVFDNPQVLSSKGYEVLACALADCESEDIDEVLNDLICWHAYIDCDTDRLQLVAVSF
jgi:hypothetical protein